MLCSRSHASEYRTAADNDLEEDDEIGSVDSDEIDEQLENEFGDLADDVSGEEDEGEDEEENVDAVAGSHIV